MSMPPYQPPADAVLVNPIEPFESPEMGALVTALSAHLDSPTYRIELGAGPVKVQGTAWAPDAMRAPYDTSKEAAVRRTLYDAVEEAIASVERLGWTHAKKPEIHITAAERCLFESVSPPRVGAHVLLTLRLGDAPPSLREMPK